MNLLIEKAPDYITVGGCKIKMKTDFRLWVRFLIAGEKRDSTEMNSALSEIFGNVKIRKKDAPEFFERIHIWLSGGNPSGERTGRPAFSFDEDGNVLYAELWNKYPGIMEKEPSFHEVMELIKNLLHDENTEIWHRAFARCGNFSNLTKTQQKYWSSERSRLRLRDNRTPEEKKADFAAEMGRLF